MVTGLLRPGSSAAFLQEQHMIRRRRPNRSRAFASAGVLLASLLFSATPGAQADLTPPTIVIASPRSGASGVSSAATIKATFSEDIQPATLVMELRNASNAVVASAVAYDAATRTGTLDPAVDLPGSQTFTVLVSGARDAAGNTMIAAGWSFTTGTAGFQDVVLAQTGLVDPTVIQFSADGRVFVAEKSGRVYVFDDLADPSPALVLDLRTSVHNFWDRGLLGMALHPAFPGVPYIYVLYAYDAFPGGSAPQWGDNCPTPPGATTNGCVVTGRLSRLNVGDSSRWPLMPASEEVLVTDWFQQFPSHSTGSLGFGADGALYASAGDGASFNYADYGQTASTPAAGDPPSEGGALRSQDIRTAGDSVTLDGSIIRLDPDTGAALPDNPRAADPDANGKRLVAHGLRNPFRFTVRPGTNELWIGDVGWNIWEEINRVVDGSDAFVDNFGWPCYEGAGIQSGYDGLNVGICETLYGQSGAVTPPHYTYNHGARVVAGEACPTGSSSISGLAFVPRTGGTYPAAYAGALFFSDYSRNCIWAMRLGVGDLPNPSDIVTIRSGAGGPVHLIAGPGGDIYYAGLNDDRLHRIRYSSGNLAPTAVAQASPAEGAVPLLVTFSAAGSSDPEGQTLSYAWDLDGDGAFDDSTVAAPQFTYTADGPVTVRVRVLDPGGLADVAAVVVSPGNSAPEVTIDAPVATLAWKVGDIVTFAGSATDAQDGAMPASSMEWTLIMHHCPSNCHVHELQTMSGIAGGTFTAPDHEYPSHLELKVTATDSGGMQRSASVMLDPQTVPLTFTSTPPGAQISVNGASTATPFTRTVIIGSSNSVSAPAPQLIGSVTYDFGGWSDGGAQVHNVIAPATATTYTAAYVPPPDTTPPVVSLTSPAPGSLVTGTVVLQAAAQDNSGSVASAQFYVNGSPLGSADTAAPYTASWNTAGLSGLQELSVRATDAAGNEALSAPVTVNVDNVPPTISMTAPAPGATLSGVVTVSADAADTNAIVDVQFRVDGVNIGAADGSAPYSVSWNTASIANGTHALTAVARDTAGNTTTSAARSVTVSNWAPPAGLVAAYTFEAGSGTIVADASGNGRTGTMSGGVAWAPVGRFGQALSFNGSTGLVSIADAVSLDFTSSMTIEAWVSPTVLGSWDTVVMKSFGSSGRAYALYAGDGTGLPAATIRSGSSERSAAGSTVLPLNTWSHVAMTYGAGWLRVYVNGLQVGAYAGNGNIRTSTDPLSIGGSSVWGRWFAGLIDEVRLYNRALSQSEIQAGMNRTVGGS
jgi:glucose/arabinose dehydrogenase